MWLALKRTTPGACRACIFCIVALVSDRGLAGGLEQGRWHELADTRLADCAPQPLPPGITGFPSVTGAWNGAVLDSRRGRLLVWGGGHGDYAGNEIYAFDPAQRKWSIVWGPTPNGQIPNEDRAYEVYLDGNPASRHTYDNIVYDPEADALWATNGSLWRSGSRTAATWRFSIADSAWERLKDSPAPGIFGQTAYDPERKLIVWRNENGSFFQFDPRRNSWRQTTNPDASTHWEMNGELDPVARQFVMVGGGRFEVYDLDSRRLYKPRPDGDTDIIEAKAPGLAWHPASGGIVAWGGGKRLYLLKIDKNKYNWTAIEPETTGDSPPAPLRTGTYGRFRFVEAVNAFVLVNKVKDNVFLYQLDEPSVALPGDGNNETIPVVAPSDADDTVARFKVRRALKSDTDVVTFGSVFSAGDLPPGQSLAAFISDKEVPVQFDAKALHRDGSVRHGVVSVVIPHRVGRRARALELRRAGAGLSGPGMTLSDLPEAFDTVVTISAGGRTYRAVASQLLKTQPVSKWLDGPLVTEWRVSGPLVTADGTEHPNLAISFGVRALADRDAVRIDVVVENTWTFPVRPQNIVYDLEIKVGDKIYASEAGIEHYRQARWRKVFWWGDEAGFFLHHHLPDLVASGAVPRYNPALNFDEQDHVALYRQWKDGAAQNGIARRSTMGSGLLHPNMPVAGDRPDIGPLPGWTVQYLLSMDPRAKFVTLRTADRAGSFPSHYRDRKTGLPVSIEDYPKTNIHDPKLGPDPLPACDRNCEVPYTPETAHLPSMAFIPYLVTGDFYYLEEMLFWGTFINLYLPQRYRFGSKGIVRSQQVRGQAWSLRTLGQIAWIIPAAHPQAEYWSRILHNNIEYYTARYIGLDGRPPLAPNALGIVTEGVSWGDQRLHTSWMDDFFTWTMSYLVALGYEEARPMLDFKVKYVIERMANDDFCHIFAAINTMYFRDSERAPVYETIAQVYEKSVDPKYRRMPCGGAKMARALGLQNGQLLPWRPDPPRGFPLYMQIALAAAVDSGNERAPSAWRRWEAQTNPRDPNQSPEWSIVPRSEKP